MNVNFTTSFFTPGVNERFESNGLIFINMFNLLIYLPALLFEAIFGVYHVYYVRNSSKYFRF